MKYKDEKLKITVSLGVRHVTASSYATAQQVINQADEALYDSKKNGRNKSTMYNPGLLSKAAGMVAE